MLPEYQFDFRFSMTRIYLAFGGLLWARRFAYNRA